MSNRTVNLNQCEGSSLQYNTMETVNIGGDCDLSVQQYNAVETDCEFTTMITSSVNAKVLNEIEQKLRAEMEQGGVSVSEDQEINTSIHNMLNNNVTVENFILLAQDCINSVTQGNHYGTINCAGTGDLQQKNESAMNCIFKAQTSMHSDAGITNDVSQSTEVKMSQGMGMASGASSLIILVILIFILTQ